MNYDIERKYFIERIGDFVRALEDFSGELHVTEDNRVLFRVSGRPFEALAWVDEDHDLVCITSRTADMPVPEFNEAVKLLQSNLQICWEHCVAVSPVEHRYDISMALFIGGCTFEAFEGVVFNLLSCAEAIEENVKPGKKKKKEKS
jgi:hypothetical protein